MQYILWCNLFLWCKTEFAAPLLQSFVSHDSSEIILICWFDAQHTFLLLSMLKIVVLLNIFVETMMGFFSEFLMARKFQHLFDIDKCLSVTVTLDQFNVSLLKKIKITILTDPKLLVVYIHTIPFVYVDFALIFPILTFSISTFL